ncbi:sulfurtransferase TusA family protein [bacterium]|nr:sulfurtransferase TusA family protein [bacterium]
MIPAVEVTPQAAEIPEAIRREIEIFSVEVERYRRGQIGDDQFKPFRLQHGIYGQRQSDVQMVRVKIPGGGLNASQLARLADVADEYSEGICHVTTRQDIQYHWVRLDRVPGLMTQLAEVGLTTREACGNTIRNVTGCPMSGVCQTEAFDVTPYARAVSRHFLRNPLCQQLARKFKIAFSGCSEKACGLAHMHCIGAVAQVRQEGGVERRGFKLFVGGGLGPAPYQAQVLSEFLPEEELVPTCHAIVSVYNRMGERRNRNKARVKFLVDKLGIEKFRQVVFEERAGLEVDPDWNAYLKDVHGTSETAPEVPPVESGNGHAGTEAFEQWVHTNVAAQKQAGYCAASVTLPLGDITSEQLRDLAGIAQRFAGGRIRTAVDQNFLLRWVRQGDLPALHQALCAAGLGEAGSGSIVDVTACPGADTCNLGITSSRGLAREIRKTLLGSGEAFAKDLEDIKIKISGCPNSCGQHHIANIGFFGTSVRVGDRIVPHFQLVLGGQTEENAAAYGLATVKIPSKNAPAAVRLLADTYRKERKEGERFNDFIRRLGKARLRDLMADLRAVPAFEEGSDYYRDWGHDAEFSLKDMGVGECAGQLVEMVELQLSESDRDIFEANLLLEKGRHGEALERVFEATLKAMSAMLTTQGVQPDGPQKTLELFQERCIQPGLIAHTDTRLGAVLEDLPDRVMHPRVENPTADRVRLRIDEAVLLVEACHLAYNRMKITPVAPAAEPAPAQEAEQPAAVEEIAAVLDLSGVQCPFNYVQAKLQLEQMEPGQLLEITIDAGEPIRNVPKSLRNDGHQILDTKKVGGRYRLVIRKG